MKRFNKRYEAWETNAKWTEWIGKGPDFSSSAPNLEMGDHILFQWISRRDDKTQVSRPISAIFVGWSIWDQALVMNYLEKSRAWMQYCEVRNIEGSEYYSRYDRWDPQIASIALWDDDIKLLGHWKAKPGIGELRQAIKFNPDHEIKKKYVEVHF